MLSCFAEDGTRPAWARDMPRAWHTLALLACVGCYESHGLGDDADASCVQAPSSPSTPDASSVGVVKAAIIQSASSTEYAAFANFGIPWVPACADSWQASGDCCCSVTLGLPLPGPLPEAGPITIASAACTPLVTLVPDDMSSSRTPDATDPFNFLHGPYGLVSSLPWAPADVLGVSAPGDLTPRPGASGPGIDALHGSLRTGNLLTDVSPPVLSAAVPIDLHRAFTMSWAAEGLPGEQVQLLLSQPAASTTGYPRGICTAPDSAQSISVDAALLSSTFVAGQPGVVQLQRQATSQTSAGSVTISLVGIVALVGTATFQ